MLIRIIKNLTVVLCFSLLTACSSPEEIAMDSQAKGIELYNRGEYAKAELELKSAIQQDATVADAYYYLALVNEKNRNFKSMKDNLIEAIKLKPENLDAKLRLGKVLLLLNEAENALIQVKEILERDADNVDAKTLEASILIRQKKMSEALPILDEVLKQDPMHSDALSLKAALLMEDQHFDEALSLIEPAIESDRDNLSLRLLKIKIDAQNKDIDAVIADYQDLIRIFPEKDELKYALAKIYSAAKKNQEAERILTELADQRPNDVQQKLILLGFIYQTDRNRTDEVLQGFIKKSQETPKHLLELAKWTLMVNNVSAAKQQLKDIADNKNFKPDVRTEADLLLANIYFEQGDYKATSEAVQAILNQNPNQIGAKILKAKVWVQEGQLEEASALLNTVLWDMPNSDEAIVLMGNIFLQQGELDKAQKNFKEALDINPANLQALFPVVEKAVKENHLDYAAQLLTKALARRPSNEVSVLNKLVQIKMVQRDWEAAEKLISAMESQPKSIFLGKFLRGKLYQEQGDCSKAIPLFKETLARYPAQADSLTEMARCHEMIKQRPKMLAYLNDLIKEGPANISAIVLKSKLLTLDRQFDHAVTLLKKAIDDYPNSVSIYSELARVYSQKNQIKDALRIYQLGLERNPANLELSMLLASTYVDQKKYDEAVAIYNQVIEKNPKLDIARNNLAAILLDHYGQADDIEKAVQLVQRFKYSDQPYFIDTYAWAEFKAGRLNQALSILQKVIVSAPDVPVFRYHLASVYHALGNKSAALSELRQVIELAKSTQFDQLDDAKQLMRQLSGKSE